MPCQKVSGTVVQSSFDGKPVSFFVSHEKDAIQRPHLNGKFHELEELMMIKKYVPNHGLIIDVGANVGNHALFYEKFLNPKEVIVIEPNPAAIATLKINLVLNGCERVNQQYLGIGLSDKTAKAKVAGVGKFRLGAARLSTDEDGSILVKTGDSLFWKHQIDFIKIDVEGLEIEVLRGFELTVKHSRPLIFIEVFDSHVELFKAWLEQQSYTVLERRRYHDICENYLAAPVEHYTFYQELADAQPF
jgi:FkbM family methyltransferase